MVGSESVAELFRYGFEMGQGVTQRSNPESDLGGQHGFA